MDNENFLGQLKFHYKRAEKWTKAFQNNIEIEDSKKESKCFNSRESLEAVLALKTEAVRAYMGINDNNENTLVCRSK
jgi:hypothetical protein